jgi:malate synthase
MSSAANATTVHEGVEIRGPMGPRYDEVLTLEALELLGDLHRRFDGRRLELLEARRVRQERFDAGELPDFLPETAHIRAGNWKVGTIPADLLDRRVEITGPVDRKMIINALNSGAKVFMADFEDATSPTWANLLEGQINLKDRWAGELDFTDPESGKRYELGPDPAVLMVRPRGWHLPEAHVLVDGAPMSGALFDFALYALHNARAALDRLSGAYFYLPKMESHHEAQLWEDVFSHVEDRMGLLHGSFRCTVLIETLPAAFEMDEILHALRDHIVGLNCGRWDYIFSFIKRIGKAPRFLTPDRGLMTMDKAFLRAYSLLCIQTCHNRDAFAMGGMAAQIPNRRDPVANEEALDKVRADKEREANDGHDGTWVAHPDLVPVAMEVFDRVMPLPNQIDIMPDAVIGQADLLQVHEGARTEEGLRQNIRVGVQYIEAWLRGRGAVPLYNLMEDAATAEISRAQVWQWLHQGASLADGRKVTPELFREVMADEMAKVHQAVGAEAVAKGRFTDAEKLFAEMSLASTFPEFLTLPAYELIR